MPSTKKRPWPPPIPSKVSPTREWGSHSQTESPCLPSPNRTGLLGPHGLTLLHSLPRSGTQTFRTRLCEEPHTLVDSHRQRRRVSGDTASRTAESPTLIGLASPIRAVTPEIVTLLTRNSYGGLITNRRPWSERAKVSILSLLVRCQRWTMRCALTSLF